MSKANRPSVRCAAALTAITLLVTGCASVSPDHGFNAVAETTKARLGKDARIVHTDADQRALAETIDALLRKPLATDDAVQIAILNNRSLQATYWSVGIAEADLVQAGRLQNPSFTFKRTHAGAEIDIERTLSFNIISLLTAPLAQRIEGRRFEQTRLLVANEILKHAAETRRAYYEAVAARQGVEYARQVSSASEASAELAERMARAGNWSQLDLSREQAFHAEAAAAVVRASRQAVAAREKLTRLMGLWGQHASYTLPDRLPELPAAPLELANVERVAMQERLDIQATKIEAAETASSLGLTKATRFVNVLDLGYLRNSTSGLPAASGYEISVELPLFDWGTARVAKAEAVYMQSVNKVAQTATDARSEARERYLDYRASYDLAKHYRDQVIPLRKKISDETLLRYNGMLLSVFELLADSREQAAAVNGYINALKEFWVAQTKLESALGGRLPAGGAAIESEKETKQ